MDASQYKDYVLVMLFIKYVSDKYADVPFAPIQIPKGASFRDMVALKGQPDIGDRINKKIIGIGGAGTSNATTVYDPTCGSGSLLLKVGHEAKANVTLYGQEKDAATSGLARMNMILHDNPGALVMQGNTLADPKFRDEKNNGALKTFDYVVANPPFSDKRWSNGLDPLHDAFGRFNTFGVPPAKQGDYAYLLHIVRSLKSTGKGACILPHGVLFRGNAEADIRRNLVKRGYLKGKPLLDPYGIYQHLMDYWAETMQDDCHLIATDGWRAETYRVVETDKKGKEKDKGWGVRPAAQALHRRPLLPRRAGGDRSTGRRHGSHCRQARRTGGGAGG